MSGWRFANEKITKRRKALGLSKRALARKTAISEVSLRRLEAGIHQARASSLASLATALGVSPGYFFIKSASIKDVRKEQKGERNGSDLSGEKGDHHEEGRRN